MCWSLILRVRDVNKLLDNISIKYGLYANSLNNCLGHVLKQCNKSRFFLHCSPLVKTWLQCQGNFYLTQTKCSSETLWPASFGILMYADRPGSWRDWTSEWNEREHHVAIWNEDARNISDLRQPHPGCGLDVFFPVFSECKMGLTEKEKAPWHSVHSQAESSFDL